MIELWEYTSATPFSSATKVWEGAASSVFLAKFDTTTRYYWIRAKRLNGFVSDTVPATSGAPSGAASDGTALNATISTSSISKSDSGASITTASVTVSPSCGTAPYTYSWTKVTGDTITADSSTAATTTFSATSMASGASRVATFRCTVTDNVAATVTRDVVVTITRSSMSVSLSPSSLFPEQWQWLMKRWKEHYPYLYE